MNVSSPRLFVDALGPNGAYRSQHRLAVEDVAGHPLAELSLVPRLFVTRAMAALQQAQTLPLQDRLTALARAGKLFATGEIDGLSAAAYQSTVSRLSGTPLPVVRAAMEGMAHRAAEAYWSAQQARPSAAVNDWRDPLAREGAGMSWRCTRLATTLACTVPGWSPWLWASGWPSGPRGGNPSLRID